MTIIKEFLVALGYQVDEGQLRKFDANIAKSTKTVEALGKSISVVTLAVAAGIEEMTRHLEDLYYVAQRSNTTVAALQSMRYAAQQIGIGADDVTASIANMSRELRENPGKEGMLNNLGVQTRNAKGEMRDMTEVYLDFVKKMKDTQPFYMAQRYAAQFGISGDQLLTAELNVDKLIAKNKEYAKVQKAAGIDAKDLSEKSVAFQNALGDVNRELDIFGMLMVKNFVGPATDALKVFDELLQYINNLDQETKGWSTTVVGLAAAWVSVKTALAALRGTAALLGLGGGAAAAAGAGAGGGAAAAGGGLLGGTLGFLLRRGSPLGAGIAALYGGGLNKGEDAAVKALQNPTKYAMDFYMAAGWTKAQAAGIVANQLQESQLQIGASGDSGKAFGLSQWHPDRQAAFARFAGHDIRSSTFDEQLAFTNFELRQGNEQAAGRALSGSTTAGEAASAYLSAERPMDMVGQGALRSARASRLMSDSALNEASAGPAVDINQKTDIHIHGVTDPHAAGSVAAAEQSRVNSNLLRNAAGALH